MSERNLDYYQSAVESILEEPSDAGVVLLVSQQETGPYVDKVVEYTGFPEEFVHRTLWRADIYDIFNSTRWHENGVEFMMAVLVVEGLARREKRGDEWVYKSYLVNERSQVDGRALSQHECSAIVAKYEVTRKEAWELWKEKTIDIDEVTIDASRVDPFEPE